MPRARLVSSLAALAIVVAVTPAVAQIRDYGVVVPASAQTQRGLFDVHQVDDTVLFEIPDSVLGRDMIIMSRYARAQEGLSTAGANMAPNITVQWERRGDRILIRAMSYQNVADEGSPVAIAVENSSFPPILHSLPIHARGQSSSVVDVTDLYLGDTPLFSLPRGQRASLGVQRYDRDRSWLEAIHALPTNLDVRVVQTYAATQAPSNARGQTVSFEASHSMVLLPETPMMPRLWDERTGLISMEVTNYSDDFQGVRPVRYLIRKRMEPSDPAAYARGELVDPVEPWIWYIDPAVPENLVPYVEAGLLEWNGGFEQAGFKNAIQVRRAPTEEEDPSFSLLDARFSVVRYNATAVRSANAGADVVDPRSGEVIRSHMNLYHGLAERMRWQLVSQVATANEQFQTQSLSPEDLGEAIRYVVSHESAHAIGLPHNQRANFVYPVESLRDPAFVAEWGHSASSVGRTRFNYAAQPGDGVPPERRMGVWDKFAVMWGYRVIPGATTPEAEGETLDTWIVERAGDPWYRFGAALFGMDVEWDPLRMTEGISADPVQAAVYGMKNLYGAAESLMTWVLDEGDDYYELETHHLQLLTQWNRYAEHAAAAVGGSYTHLKRYGEEGPIYTPVDRDYQLKAMAFIDEFILSTPRWALDINQLRRIEHAGVVERVRAYQELAVQRLLNHARLARMIEHEAFLGDATYRPADMLDDTRKMIWREMYARDATDTFRRNLQRAYLQQADFLLNEATSDFWTPPSSGNLRVGSNDDPPLNADLHIGQSDIRPLIRDQLTLLRAEVEQALAAGMTDRMTRIHLEDALVRIKKALGV
jgi:hypothetical protein